MMELKEVLIEDFLPLPESQYDFKFIEFNRVLKLVESDELLLIGVCDPENHSLLSRLQQFHDVPVEFCLISESDLHLYLSRSLGIGDASGADDDKESPEFSLDKIANDAPVVNFVNSILLDAVRRGASDIHFESFSDKMMVRFRIDGILININTLSADRFPAVSARVKIMADLNIMERRKPQDGRISVSLGGQVLDLRVSTIPIARGESIVLRLFNKSDAPQQLTDLGLSEDSSLLIDSICRSPNGLFLVTGPTGSGKTTTLGAILRKINSAEKKIITVEDPIENEIPGISQIQTNEKIGITFADILRRILRQDPDIIMIGEIRDSETAEMAVKAALTGHFVISTLHTNDSTASVQRLLNMGVEPFLLAAVLRGVVAQRLVRKLCSVCKVKAEPEKHVLRMLASFGLDVKEYYRPCGCKNCNNTGYKGRIAIIEGFDSDSSLEELISSSATTGDLLKYLKDGRGFQPLLYDGCLKISEGLTTIEEVLRVV
ncbi:MAG: type II/IV secretion system protein [Spirochaetales bacterium]|nr:type II/IV secretion system protein [Spirochaetales bacterium]